jgi:hypothetical protein
MADTGMVGGGEDVEGKILTSEKLFWRKATVNWTRKSNRLRPN